MKLTDKQWKEFYIKDIFITEKRIKTQVPTGAYIHKKNLTKGNTPRITVTSQNNGVDGYWTSFDKNYRCYKNFISVSFLGTTFYHPYIASIDMKVHCLQLIHKPLNLFLSIFLIAEIRKSIENASYGNQISSTDLPNKKIMLPVDEHGNPDYVFMEGYIKELERTRIPEYVDYCKEKLALLRVNNEVSNVKNAKWQSFYVQQVFDKPQRGKRIVKENHTEGRIPLVSSYGQGNGVTHFVGNEGNVRKFSNCISVANGGSSAGKTFYQPYTFIASDHVTQCWSTNLNQYQYLFLATTMTKAFTGKYSFSHEISDPRLAKEKIMLPALPSGEPDYDYMERYGKKMIAQKYQEYLDYID